MSWQKVEEVIESVQYQTWDGCHKIYLIKDEFEAEKMRSYEYELVEPNINLLIEWFEDSCGLRFIEMVETEENGERKFTTLIGQFELDDYNNEEDFDVYVDETQIS